MTRPHELLRFGFTAWRLPARSPGFDRKIVHYGLSAVAVVAAVLIVYLILAGWLYPLRPDTIEHLAHPFADALGAGTWGGPTFVGAWAVHAAIAVAMQLAALVVIALCRAGIVPRRGGGGQLE
ncbi:MULTISPECIES: hypothetical protein [Prauserella salsuginis group]|uniref:Uncharacterized protein n=1 Tax=Prauserella salsuginis TaxID=387889 RepID=A0ABW6FX59_9PSEU|nr:MULTISPECIES: hypothetical protein [Prauserella salsuginis group]MCR3720575.1 hypothetical protein [Prauserella flava]MCR3733715.1 hypothetical protein [Prauserella salsuginis]